MNALSLNGDWKLRWSDGQRGRPQYAERPETDESRYIDAVVPGEVHLDLRRAGLIPDFYLHGQAKECRWVEDCIWSYRRFFEAPEEALTGSAWLHFQSLDLSAKIVLNGEEIATHQNVFHPCRVEVTGRMKAGRNLLTVHVDPGLLAVAEKPHAGYLLQGFDQKLHKRHWLRKPQNQFSWDWSPRLINTGIGGDVRLEYTAEPVRLDQFVALVDVNPELDRGFVRGRFFLENLAAPGAEVSISIALEGVSERRETKLEAGITCHEVRLEIPAPQLWWPRGHGGQPLYTLHAQVIVDGKVIEERTRQIGFRRVRVNQERHPVSGTYFIFEINNRPIFLKGANLVPADLIYSSVDRERYGILLDRAEEANFNFLRIWGGGVYESEDFYDLCDARGIVVWQEFVYACGKYPLHDEAYFTDAKKEATYQIRRLAHRPSLIAWCGNNEIDMFDAWPVSESGIVHGEYAYFHNTLPRLMREEDPGRYFQPSSPYSPDHLPANQDDTGDQHPWSIGFFDLDFYKYRAMICRFPNEGGFLGPTALPTMHACLPEGQKQIGSFAWQYHDNSVDSWEEPSPVDNITQEWLGRNIRTMSVEEFTYWGGLIQGEALREYIEAFRHKMFSSSCACFWMFNDCWPAVRSWTVVDFALRRTPCFHPVRRAFAPVHVVLAQVGEEIRVHGINETPESMTVQLRHGVFQIQGAISQDHRAEVVLPANTSTVIATFPAAWIEGDSAAFAVLESGGQVIARNRLFLRKFREMAWAKAEVEVVVREGVAEFSSAVFAWGVCLDLDGETTLGDNFFDLYPGMVHRIPWTGEDAPKILRMGNLVP